MTEWLLPIGLSLIGLGSIAVGMRLQPSLDFEDLEDTHA